MLIPLLASTLTLQGCTAKRWATYVQDEAAYERRMKSAHSDYVCADQRAKRDESYQDYLDSSEFESSILGGFNKDSGDSGTPYDR